MDAELCHWMSLINFFLALNPKESNIHQILKMDSDLAKLLQNLYEK